MLHCKKAKSTAAEIAKLDQKLAAAKRYKLADNLRQAQRLLVDTAAGLIGQHKAGNRKQTELAKIKPHQVSNFKPSTLSNSNKQPMLNNPRR
ncbi:MAG: hypothetical protein ACLSBB_16455 [Ruthenibacterium lactatiformans]